MSFQFQTEQFTAPFPQLLQRRFQIVEAFAAFSLAKYPGYKNERLKAAIQVVYDEMK